VKLNFKSRMKVLLTGSVEEYNRAFLSGEDAPAYIDTETAMKYSVVNACVRVLSETFASVPIMLYKKLKDSREPITDHAVFDILHNRPNEEMSPFNFNEVMMTNFCVNGNAVCERQFSKSGEMVGLYPYSHRVFNIGRNETGRLEYVISGKTETRRLDRGRVLHVPNMSFDGVIGLSPIAYAAETIRLGLSYEQYGTSFYRNGATPSGVLEHPDTLSDEAFMHLKEDLKRNYAGLRNSGTPMILEEGMKWVPLTFTPADSQLIESKYFQIEDICRIFRVPQHLVNKLDRSTNNNIEHQSLEFVMYTMLPIYKRFEDNINSQLLSAEERKAGLYFEYKLDGLLRGDSLSRAQSYAQGRQWGWLSVNDIRKLENMSPIVNGDIYLQPSNMVEAGGQSTVNDRLAEDIYKMLEERR
jgi:HK97 family phage portal protein